ncbi:uncharacterized protein LOC134214081 isoform X2 [Armigeres subalbatus]|uniref:uncharacterized protein LOC134214081 isoform X2 n=1 Tax=Armigeres subalbatus TaxID=124917 RepID=UPI002ED2521A
MTSKYNRVEFHFRSGRLYLLYLKTEFHKTPLLAAVEEFVHEQITNKFKFHLKELVSMNVIASVLMPTSGKPSRSTYIVKGSRKKLVLRINPPTNRRVTP